ncbi:MAG: hypothetical protein WCH43_11470 [Verrucomicrobiota bacterium]
MRQPGITLNKTNRNWLQKAAFSFPLSLLALALLAGCEQHISEANLKQIRPEMSPKEVESIMGQPARIEKFQMEVQTHKPVLDGVRYYYEKDGKTIALHFVDGKLISQAPTQDGKEISIEQPAK